MGYSGRLTIIIAIDRSIRMKYLHMYNSKMTKTKANLVLMVNAVLDIVQFVGYLGPYINGFKMAYGIFHILCLVFGCLLYITTYCKTKHTVSNLQLNMRRTHVISVEEARFHHSTAVTPSHPEAHDTTEGCSTDGNSDGRNRYQNAFYSTRSQGRNNTRSNLVEISKASLRNSSLLHEMQERSIKLNVCTNDVAITSCGNSSMADNDHGNQDGASQCRNIHAKSEKTTRNSNDASNRKKNDRDIGRAMLLIVMVIIVCYIPTLVEGLLRVQNVENVILDHLARILLLANGSCNAIILTVFSRDIRNFAKTLL